MSKRNSVLNHSISTFSEKEVYMTITITWLMLLMFFVVVCTNLTGNISGIQLSAAITSIYMIPLTALLIVLLIVYCIIAIPVLIIEAIGSKIWRKLT